MRRKKINLKAIVCALMSSAMILTLVTPASAATARATTMKLEKTEGTVTLKTQNGSTRKITKGMRLYNGNTLSTAKYSYAHISLDSTKAVKLDQSSSATLRQSGKQLELLVKSGKLFFNVSKKLSAKESMNVRTSTMVTGVRGTCGVVEFVSSKQSKLYLIEGQVTLGTGSNATVVQGGQVATVILQDKPATSEPGKPDKGDQNVIAVEKLPEKNIPPVALQEIVADPVLQEKIEKTTELKIEKIEEALEQFEKEEAERIEQEKAEQEKDEEKDQEKEQDEKKEDESTSSSGGSGTSSLPTKKELVMQGTVTSGALKAAFQEYDKIHIKEANTFSLEANETLIIPGGKELILWNEQSVPGTSTIQVGEGGTKALLCVAIKDGSTARNALSAGTIEVTAGSRLEDHGSLECSSLSGGANAMLINNQELRVSDTMSLSNGTTFENHGYMEGVNLISDGGATIKNTDRMMLSGAYTSKGTDTYSDDEDADAVVVSRSESAAMPAGSLLMAAEDSSGTKLYYYYAQRLCNNVIYNMYLSSSATTGTVTWEFEKNALIPSGTTMERTDFIAKMNAFELQVEGTLKLSGVSQISGSGNATIRLKTDGNLILGEQSSAVSATPCIENTGRGYAIASDGGKFTWNDFGVSASGSNGAASAIQNATVSSETVTLPNWVTVKAGYMPIWKDNIIALQIMPSEFTSGTVTAAELNQALSVHDTVTVGQAVNANLSASDTVTVPAGKTLKIESQVTSSGDSSDQAYSNGFDLNQGTITLKDNASLHVSGYVWGTGTINAGETSGATVQVDDGGTLSASQLNLTKGSSIINSGIIDTGTITTDGTETIQNKALIKTQNYKHLADTSGTGTYSGESGSVLVNNSDLSGLLNEVSLLAYAATEKDAEGLQFFYSDSLGSIMADRINTIKKLSGVEALRNADEVWWHFEKDALVPSGTNITLTDFHANMGAHKFQVQGTLTLTGTVSISGEGSQTSDGSNQYAVIYLTGSGILNFDEKVSGTISNISESENYYVIAADMTVQNAKERLNWLSASLSIKPGIQQVKYTIQGVNTSDTNEITVPLYLKLPDNVTLQFRDGTLGFPIEV